MCNKLVVKNTNFRSLKRLTRTSITQTSCLHDKRGFSLVELMISIGILGILAAVAIPSYINFTKNGEVSEALTTLVNLSTQMEKRYLDLRNYGTGNTCGVAVPTGSAYTFSCSSDGQSYTWTATSSDSKYQYTINQNGDKTTSRFNGSTSNETCWKVSENGDCY